MRSKERNEREIISVVIHAEKVMSASQFELFVEYGNLLEERAIRRETKDK